MKLLHLGRLLVLTVACGWSGALWSQESSPSDAPRGANVANAPAALSEGEQRIRHVLAQPVTLEFIETPLIDVVEFLQDGHQIPIQMDYRALDEAGLAADVPVTLRLRDVSLRTALRFLLGPLDLAYTIDDEVLVITTLENAELHPTTRVYDVTGLLPITATDADDLAQLIRQTVHRGAARRVNGPPPLTTNPRTVTTYHHLLVVSDTEEGHYRVEKLLNQLHAKLGSGASAPNAAPAPSSGAPPSSGARPEGAPGSDPFAPSGTPPSASSDPFGGGDPFGGSVPARPAPSSKPAPASSGDPFDGGS